MAQDGCRELSRFERMLDAELERLRQQDKAQKAVVEDAPPKQRVIEQIASGKPRPPQVEDKGRFVDSDRERYWTAPTEIKMERNPSSENIRYGPFEHGSPRQSPMPSDNTAFENPFSAGPSSQPYFMASSEKPKTEDARVPSLDDRTSAASDKSNDVEMPPTKRAKISPPPNSDIPCTCSVSTTCERAAKNGVRDCRTSLTPMPRKATKPKLAALLATQPPKRQFVSTKQQARIKRANDDMLQTLVLYKRSTTANDRDLQNIFNQMRDRLQQLPFSEADASSLDMLKAKFLDEDTGFPAIVRNTSIPWDIRLDADVLRLRWEKGDLDTDLLRGLIVRRSAKSVSRSLDPGYPFKMQCIYVGEGNLRNGQWFPWQICAIRDGAHGEMEAGISGRDGLGAVSIVLSSSGRNRDYADIDQGETISYCSTRGKDGEVSAGTAQLLESANKKNEIRVLRSAKLPTINPYRPAVGLRYDGLYKITGQEVLDEESKLYRFDLARAAGQTPIRYKGPEKRPSAREIDELKAMQGMLAGSRPSASGRK